MALDEQQVLIAGRQAEAETQRREFAALSDSPAKTPLELASEIPVSTPASPDDVEQVLALELLLNPSLDLSSIRDEVTSRVQNIDRENLYRPYGEKFSALSSQNINDAARSAIQAGQSVEEVLRGAAGAQQWVLGMQESKEQQALLATVAANLPLAQARELNQQANMSAWSFLRDLQIEKGETPGEFEFSDLGNIAGTMFIPDGWIDADDAAEVLGAPDMTTLASRYQELSAFEKIRFWKDRMPEIWEAAEGNSLKVKAIISKIQAHDVEFEQGLSAVLDLTVVLPFIGAAKAPLKALGGLRGISADSADLLAAQKSATAAQRLKAAGSNQGAADAVLAKAAAPQDADDVAEAAKALSPFRYEGTVVDSTKTIDGVAPEILARLLENRAAVSEAQFLKDAADEFRQHVARELENEAESLSTLSRSEYTAAKAELRDLQDRVASGLYEGETLADLTAGIERLQTALTNFGAAQSRYLQAARVRKGGKLDKKLQADLKRQQAALRKAIKEAPVDPETAAREAAAAETASIERELGASLETINAKIKQAGGSAKITQRVAQATEVYAQEEARVARMVQRGVITRGEAAEILAESTAARDLHAAKEAAELLSGKARAGRDFRAVSTRDMTPAQRDRVRAAAEAARNRQMDLLSPGRRAQGQAAARAAGSEPAERAQVPGQKSAGGEEGVLSQNAEVNQLLNNSVRGIRDFLKPFKSGEIFLNPARNAFIQDTINSRIAESGGALRSAEVLSVNPSTHEFTVAYRGTTGEDVQVHKWTIDKVGSWNTEAITKQNESVMQTLRSAIGFSLSPSTLLSGIDRNLVNNLTLGGLQTARIFNELVSRTKAIWDPLSKAERRRVEALLQRGDEAAARYHPDDLLAGNIAVQAEDGSLVAGTYTVKEVDAYIQARAMYDELHAVQQEAAYRHFSFLDAKEIHINGAKNLLQKPSQRGVQQIPRADFESLVIPIKDTEVEELAKIGRGESGERILVAGGPVDADYRVLTGADVARLREQGYRPYKFQYHRDQSGTKVHYALIAEDGDKVLIAPLRRNLLGYAEGFVPRIYKPGHVFVKDARFSTVAGFPGIKEARAWRDAQVAEAAQRGERLELTVYKDNQLPPDELEIEKFSQFGGLFFMSRSDAPIVNPNTGKVLERLDVPAATQKYLSGIAEMLPLNEYRSVVMRQFRDAVNSVARLNGGKSGFQNAQDLHSPIKTGDDAADQILNDTRDYLFTHLAIPSAEENRWARFMGSVIDVTEGRSGLGSGALRSFAKATRDADIVRSTKSVVFHAYLGCFNPRQLAVQIQNAGMAASAYPEHALPAFLDYLKMRAVLFMNRDQVIELARKSGLRFDEPMQQAALLRRSGYLDAIFRNEDYRSLANGFSDTTGQHLRGALRFGTLPFLEGEMGARIISFNIAMRRFRKANPGKKEINDVDLEEIVNDSLRLGLNMQKENAARFQTNTLTGIPLQFVQVQAKFLENVIGGLCFNRGKGARSGWTRKEAAQILAGQLLMYGTVGTLGAGALAERAKVLAGEGDPELFAAENPVLNEAIDEGGFGLLFDMLGFNTVATEDLSVWAGIDNTVPFTIAGAVADVVTGHKAEIDLAKVAPAVGVAGRVGTVLSNGTINLMRAMHYPSELPELTLSTFNDIASVASSWNNLTQTFLYERMGADVSREGVLLRHMHSSEWNWQTQLASSMGFKSESEFNLFQAMRTNKDLKNQEEARVALIRKAYIQAAKGNDAVKDALLYYALDDVGLTERRQLLMEAFKDLTGKSVEDSADVKLFRNYLEGRTGDRAINLVETLND